MEEESLNSENLNRVGKLVKWLRHQNRKFYLVEMMIFIIAFLGLVFFLLPLIFASIADCASTDLKGSLEILGAAGDAVGGLSGSLWALVGVLLFYLALKMQRADLTLQRKELKQTRETYALQVEVSKKQQFEDTFFNLLKLLRETKNSIDTHRDFPESDGFDKTFDIIKNDIYIKKREMDRTLKHDPSYWNNGKYETRYEFEDSTYNAIVQTRLSDSGLTYLFKPYTDILLFITDYIKSENYDKLRYPFYSKILFTQLTSGEVKVLFLMSLDHSRKELFYLFKLNEYLLETALAYIPEFRRFASMYYK